MKNMYSRATYGAIVLLAITAIGVALYLGKIEIKDLGTGMRALRGTLMGATLAFRLNEDKEAKKEHAAQRVALNRALFVLGRQRNAVALIARALEPFKTPFDRAFNFPAAKVPPYADLIHHFDELEFLLNSPDVNTLFRLTVEQERFHQVLESLLARNDFYLREVQPEIAKHQLNGKSHSEEDVAELFGERVFRTAVNGSTILRENLDSSLKSLPEMNNDLRNVAKKLFPTHKFVNFKNEA